MLLLALIALLQGSEAESIQGGVASTEGSPVLAPRPAEPKTLQVDWTALDLPDLGPGARLGESLLLADFDGDGEQDLAIGAPGAVRAGGNGRGVVLVAMGAEGGLTEGVREVWTVAPLSHTAAFESVAFGHSLCAYPLDDDDADELVIGAPLSGAGSGSVFVWGMEGLHRAAVRLLGPETLPGALGHALLAADLEGDGAAELLVAAPGAVGESGIRSGAILVLSPGGPRRTIWPQHPREDGLFGFQLGLLDLLPGGPANLVVTEPGSMGGGRVLVRPPTGALRRPIESTLPPVPGWELPRLGASLSIAGGGLAVGAPDRSILGKRAVGGVYLWTESGLLEPRVPPQERRDDQVGGRVLLASLGGTEDPDLLATVWGPERPDARRGAWIWPDLGETAHWLPAPDGAGSRWAQGLTHLAQDGRVLLLAGDPSFEPAPQARDTNRGRVTFTVLPELP